MRFDGEAGSGTLISSRSGSSDSGRVLYVDPWAGLAGDMFLAALLDLDAQNPEPTQILEEAVQTLALPGVRVESSAAMEGGIRCLRIKVKEDDPPARNPEELLSTISDAALPGAVKEASTRAIGRLVEVEARIHGVPAEQVHLHELGAADTLVDVVGTFTLLRYLGVGKVVTGQVPLGRGWVTGYHGRLPVPAPATLELLRGCPVFAGETAGEMTTPTGALLASEITDAWGPLPRMQVSGIGYGAGSRSLSQGANVLRLVLGEETEAGRSAERSGDGYEELTLLETLVDDATPEVVAYAQERLMEAGAVDAWLRQAIGKKGRPAVELCALTPSAGEAAVVEAMMESSGTLGVRRRTVERYAAERRLLSVDVGGYEVRVKVGSWRGRETVCAAEYEDAAAVARKVGRPLSSVMREAEAFARERIDADGTRRGAIGEE